MVLQFIVMCGLPASGKSTYCNLRRKEGFVVISSDAIREEFYGDEGNQDHNSEVFKEVERRIKVNLECSNSVILDACNVSSRYRTALLQRVRGLEKRIGKIHASCMIMRTSYNDCIARSHMRSKDVPDYVIYRMYKNFNIPYWNEGWDSINFVNGLEFETYDPVEVVNSLTDFNQDNHHHTLSLGSHMKMAYKIAEKNNFSKYVRYAALIHDIGKAKTKVFCNRDGVKTEEAHYYNHENISAYDGMFMKFSDLSLEGLLHVLFLVNQHMKPYGWNNGQCSKYEKKWGKDFYEEVQNLHYCDVESH
jgi:predicted kinase